MDVFSVRVVFSIPVQQAVANSFSAGRFLPPIVLQKTNEASLRSAKCQLVFWILVFLQMLPIAFALVKSVKEALQERNSALIR